ncbi:MAG: AAA family ATPase [Bacteroidetes bacterium]|nr:AAA family ATPase [Bacteroidota bacterium]
MSSASVKQLADFLNHGILPFVGRTTESSRLLEFWRQTIDAQGLRALLLVGEAGIGKSRLIEETIPRIISAGGAVIHAKLYPESATNITPLLARSLWHSTAGRELLKKQPENTRDSLVEGMRRVASLRPTIIFLEDIHLLSSEGARECAAFFESVADETISFVAAARPSLMQVRGVLERYLTDEIHLEGLDHTAFTTVCAELFGGAIHSDAVALLERATLGNSLALRSALRGALKSGSLAKADGTGQWHIAVGTEAFVRQLEQNVRSLSEGMAANVPDEESIACERLAVLGELFAVEAAEALLPDAKTMLDRLTFQGMLVTSSSAHVPVNGSPSVHPLHAFSHSLVHRYFLGRSPAPGADLLKAIASGIPLYGIAPFLALADITQESDAETMRAVIQRADEAARTLDGGSDWELALQLWSAAKQFFDRHRTKWESAEAERIEIQFLKTHLMLLRRQLFSEEYGKTLAELYAITDDPQTFELADQRMAAYVFRHWQIDRLMESDDERRALRADVNALLERFPDLAVSHTYTVYLSYEAKAAAQNLSHDIMRDVEEAARTIVTSDRATQRLRDIVQGYIYPHFLVIFDTSEELAERLALARRIEESNVYDNIMFPIRKTEMLSAIGRMRDALAELHKYIPQFRREGLSYTVFLRSLDVLSIEAWYGRPLDEVLHTIRELFAETPADLHEYGRQAVTRFFIPVGVYLGASGFVKQIIDEFGVEGPTYQSEYYLLASLFDGESPDAHLASCTQPERMRSFYDAARAASRDDASTTDALLDEARVVLSHEVIQQRDILCALLVIELTKYFGRDSELAHEIRDTIGKILDWFAADDVVGCLRFILRRYGAYLMPKDERAWKSRIAKMGLQPSVTATATDGMVRLSMLGATIEITKADGSSVRVRGARLRSVLGVMTANQMLEQPLSVREFRLIAAGEKDDAELARKSVNMAVAALRDDLGPDAIVTTGETPSLNLARIRIDLLEANNLLTNASRALRRGSLVKALPDLSRALDIALGKVPFPTLYDNLFEAIRDDFDARMRTLTLDIAKRLVAEGDRYSAINLMRKYFDAMPDDEEIATLLRTSLESIGQKAEAERINLKASLIADR